MENQDFLKKGSVDKTSTNNNKRFILFGLCLLIVILAVVLVSLINKKRTFTEEGIYSANGLLDIHQGTVICWLRFLPSEGRRDHVILHTDDSRIVLYVDTFFSRGMQREILRIAARAGGVHRAVDTDSGGQNFPEASIIVDNDGGLASYRYPWYSPVSFPENEWHLIAMTWDGYPSGTVRIYFDGQLTGEKPYDSRYDDERPLFNKFSIGFRPHQWLGEIKETAKGLVEGLPNTAMSLSSGGIKIKGLRIYSRVYSQEEFYSIKNQEDGKQDALDDLMF